VGLGEGMAGRGGDAAAAAAALAPAFTRADELMKILDEQNRLLGAVIDRAAPVLSALGSERGGRLDRLVAATGTLLGATAAARPVVAGRAAAGGDFERMARSGRSLAEAFPPDLSNLLDFIRNVALASSGADGISHYLRIFSLSRDEALNGRFPKGPPGAPGSGTASLASLAPTPS